MLGVEMPWAECSSFVAALIVAEDKRSQESGQVLNDLFKVRAQMTNNIIKVP